MTDGMSDSEISKKLHSDTNPYSNLYRKLTYTATIITR